MSKYEYTDKMSEISGFGGGYEDACRRMVIAGLEWCDEQVDPDISFEQFKNIYGVTTGESEDAKKMQNAMLDEVSDCTGAMMQACMNHVMYIRENGWEQYKQEMTNEIETNKG